MKVRRPVIWILTFYGIGILIGHFWWVRIAYLLMAVISTITLYLILGLTRQTLWTLLLFTIFLFFGLLNTNYRVMTNRDLDIFLDNEVVIRGQVLEKINQTPDKLSFILEIDRISHEDENHISDEKIRVSIYTNPESEKCSIVEIGDRIKLKGKIEKPRGRRNPKGFDYRAYLARRGIHYTLGVPEKDVISIMPQNLPAPRSWFIATKSNIAHTFETYIGGRESNLLKSMVIGERWALPSMLRDEFSRTGIAHILAISGLHVGFLVLLLYRITRILTLSPRAGFILQSLVLILYCLLVGSSPSIVRATIMSLIILGGRALGRKPDPLNSLCLAALIILIKNPLDLFDVGFQLSFGAVLGIVLYNDILKNFIQNRLSLIPKKIDESIALMIAAQLGTWPIIAFYFNMFSPISFIANLILVPLAGVIITLGFLFPPIALVIPKIAIIIGWWLKILSGLLIDINSGLSGLSWASFWIVSPSLLFIIIYYLILLVLSDERPRFIKRPIYVTLLLSLIIIINAIVIPLLDKDFMVVFVDVGQGDCTYIKTPDRKHILIDGGGRREGAGDFDVGYEVVLPFLLKNGVRKLDLMVMSHGHEDHFGGLIPVAKEIEVGAFMEYPPREPVEKYKTLKEILNNGKIPCIEVRGGQSFKVGDNVYLDILYPVSSDDVLHRLYDGNENNLSLVVRVRFEDTDILLTGDIEERVESYLSKIWDERVSILKVAHHGSKTSSTEEWIDIIDPYIAVIQSGKNNFGHPDSLVIERFLNKGARVFENHSQGAIICTYKKGEWRIKTMVGG